MATFLVYMNAQGDSLLKLSKNNGIYGIILSMKEVTVKTKSEEETIKVGKKIAGLILNNNIDKIVISLIGELGAGKTVIAKGIAEGIGCTDSVESPTFTFLHIHKGKLPLYHFDLYRVNDINDIDEIGMLEYIEKIGITVIEWGDKIKDLVEIDLIVKINKIDENEREINLIFSEMFRGAIDEDFIN